MMVAAIGMRHFQEIKLVGEDGTLIFERRYSDHTVEWWALMNVHFQINGQPGAKTCPYQIEAANREAVFLNQKQSMGTAKPVLQAQVKLEIDAAMAKQRGQIVIANSIDRGAN